MTPTPLSRRSFLSLTAVGAAALSLPQSLRAADAAGMWRIDPTADLIPAPDDPALWPQFRAQLAAWRAHERQVLGYSDALYRRPEFAWAAANYACGFLLLGDERFYDAKAGRYRVREWLGEIHRAFNGVDSVVLWHAYPRIGLDERNQFDFYRDAPGGLLGLRAAVDELHQAGVRVYLDYLPWDTGTRREERSDIDTLCDLIATLDADGLFLDTMGQGGADFRRKLDAVRPGVVLEGERALPLERITDHHLAWAQRFRDSEAPGVVRNKWFERRHQLHFTARWSRDRTAQFHAAFMNGCGTLIWDNVFGTWNGYSPREQFLLRALLPIQRRFTALFSGEDWTPLVPTRRAEIYASLWADTGVRLWTLVNRAETATAGELLELNLGPGEQLWDLVAGREVPAPDSPLRGRGVGCYVAARRAALGADFDAFLQGQRATDGRADWSTAFPDEVQTRLKAVTRTRGSDAKRPPPDMVAIPGGPYRCQLEIRPRECGEYESTHPRTINRWPGVGAKAPLSQVTREVVLPPYAIDLTPVTNARFAEFLRGSGYRPVHSENFLRHWPDGKIPAGLEEHPVIHVDLADARAYARWAGKRLPTEEEWQFAAQGTAGRRYPWGNEWDAGRCNGDGAGTTPVKQFPAGRSPFGLYDLCGNTWEWTESERTDGINRFAMVRGGSWFNATGSDWYLTGGPSPVAWATKVLLSWPALDRCSTVGFRCAADLA